MSENISGLLIAIEGIDGAGKRTICSFMKKFLESKGSEVILFEYPDYSSIWGKIIEEYLHNKIELKIDEQFFLYFIDILKDQEKISDALNKGKIIITDRYFSSTLAFQCAKGFDFEKALKITEIMDVIEPDLTLFLQIPPHVTLERKFKQKNSLDRHEKDLKLLKNVDSIYKRMSDMKIMSKNWIKIDANRDLTGIEIDLQELLLSWISKQRPDQNLSI